MVKMCERKNRTYIYIIYVRISSTSPHLFLAYCHFSLGFFLLLLLLVAVVVVVQFFFLPVFHLLFYLFFFFWRFTFYGVTWLDCGYLCWRSWRAPCHAKRIEHPFLTLFTISKSHQTPSLNCHHKRCDAASRARHHCRRCEIPQFITSTHSKHTGKMPQLNSVGVSGYMYI